MTEQNKEMEQTVLSILKQNEENLFQQNNNSALIEEMK